MLFAGSPEEGVVIAGDEEELRLLIETIERAISDGVGDAALLDDDAVTSVRVCRVE